MDVFTGNAHAGWRVNEVAYVDAIDSPRSQDRLFAIRCNSTQDLWSMLPTDQSILQNKRSRGPLSYIAEDAGIPLDFLMTEPEYAWMDRRIPWIFDNSSGQRADCE